MAASSDPRLTDRQDRGLGCVPPNPCTRVLTLGTSKTTAFGNKAKFSRGHQQTPIQLDRVLLRHEDRNAQGGGRLRTQGEGGHQHATRRLRDQQPCDALASDSLPPALGGEPLRTLGPPGGWCSVALTRGPLEHKDAPVLRRLRRTRDTPVPPAATPHTRGHFLSKHHLGPFCKRLLPP